MTFRPFDGPEAEPSRFVGFAGNEIDRQGEKRADDAVSVALSDPGVRIMLMRGGRLYLRFANGAADAGHSPDEAAAMNARLRHAVLLGHEGEKPVVAAPSGIEPEDLPDHIKAIDYRSIMVQGLLEPREMGALAQGASLLAWHGSHRHCGRCGRKTEMCAGGYKRVCPNCGAAHFPRTDPVAIMLALDGDRCLLGRGRNFPPGIYSCLAGFIEPGETIEDAVRRGRSRNRGFASAGSPIMPANPGRFPIR